MLRIIWGVTFLAVCLLAPPVFAAPLTPEQRAQIVQVIREALTQDPSILRDAIVAMQADDARRQNQAAHAAISANHDKLIDQADPVAGNPHGDVTIVEFFDPRCPYCRGLETAMAQFIKEDRGVRLIYKDLPILGPPSVLGSRALIAAQRQGAYVRLRDTLMHDPSDVTLESIRLDSQKLDLNWDLLRHDMDDPAVQKRLDSNVSLAHALGIEGTPTFIVGQTIITGADLDGVRRAVVAMRAEVGNLNKLHSVPQSLAGQSGKS